MQYYRCTDGTRAGTGTCPVHLQTGSYRARAICWSHRPYTGPIGHMLVQAPLYLAWSGFRHGTNVNPGSGMELTLIRVQARLTLIRVQGQTNVNPDIGMARI